MHFRIIKCPEAPTFSDETLAYMSVKRKMTFVDGPLKEVLIMPAEDVDALLQVRAWEVEESPIDLGYRAVAGWPNLPSGWSLGQVAGVAVDSEEHYYVYHRGNEAPPLICFDREGEYLRSWGESEFIRPHMARARATS